MASEGKDSEEWKDGRRGKGGDCLNGISIVLIIHSFDWIKRITRINVVGWAVVDDSGNGDGGGEKQWRVTSDEWLVKARTVKNGRWGRAVIV